MRSWFWKNVWGWVKLVCLNWLYEARETVEFCTSVCPTEHCLIKNRGWQLVGKKTSQAKLRGQQLHEGWIHQCWMIEDSLGNGRIVTANLDWLILGGGGFRCMPALGSIFMKSFNHYTEPITQKSERSYQLKSAATSDGRRDARMGWKAGTRDVVLRPEWERRSHIVPLKGSRVQFNQRVHMLAHEQTNSRSQGECEEG